MSIDPREAAPAIERIILRRLYEKRIEGYTLEMSEEIARALLAVPSPSPSFTEAYELGREQGRKETSPAVPSDIREALEESCPGCPGLNTPGCERPMCIWQMQHAERRCAEKGAKDNSPTVALEAAIAFARCAMAVDCYSRQEIADLARGTIDTFTAALTSSPPGDGKLREALEYYATEYCEGWCSESDGIFPDCGGCKARAALSVRDARRILVPATTEEPGHWETTPFSQVDCKARHQSLPEPAECYWPECDCPAKTKPALSVRDAGEKESKP